MTFILGNEKLSLLTMNKKYKLRIELEDFLGGKSWAEYSTFSVKPSTDKYRLTVAGYSGNAGMTSTGSSINYVNKIGGGVWKRLTVVDRGEGVRYSFTFSMNQQRPFKMVA